LDERVKQGSKDSPLLGLDLRGAKKNRFFVNNPCNEDIHGIILSTGFSWRPYVLRAYSDTNTIIAKDKINHPYLQFIIGHKDDIEARYSTNKGVLPPDMYRIQDGAPQVGHL
jgi:hypothetical protein